MKLVTTLRITLATAVLCTCAGLAMAQVVAEPIGHFGGYFVHNHATHTTSLQPTSPTALPVVVYDNTVSAVLGGLSSTDLTAVWGDEVATTGMGTLQAMTFTFYNSGSSSGPVLTANFGCDFYDGGTSAPLGSFSANVDFGAGLPPGYFTFVAVTGLEPLAIDLTTTDVILTQTVLGTTGTATRLGIVLIDPPTVGSSGPDMYIDASTIGPAGWYTVGASPANPGYQLSVISGPVPTEKSSWGRVKNLYR
jgi:hypothetical protein